MKLYIKSSNTSVKSSTEEPESRVIAIQLDVEIPKGVDSNDVINFIEDAIGNATQVDFHIASADVCGDITTKYEDEYPDLLVYR